MNSEQQLRNNDGNKKLINVQLHRDENGLGFNIIGGTDQQHMAGHSDIFISRIRPGTPAAADGRLHQGDIIVAVNGIDISAVKHEEAIRIFQSVGPLCQLLVEQNGEKRILMEPARLLVSASNTNSLSSNSSLKGELKSILKSPSPTYASVANNSDGGHLDDLPDVASIRSNEDSFQSSHYMTPLSTPSGHISGASRQQQRKISSQVQSRTREVSLSSVSYAEVADPTVDTAATNHATWQLDSKTADVDGAGDEDDRVSTAPSLLDDVPRTPKRPPSRFLDPTNPSLLTEALFVSVGVVALAAVVFFGYRKYYRSH